MMLRALSKDEIRSLSSRRGVEGKAVGDFLAGVGGMSMEAAYERLKHERKMNRWNFQTVSAISDGIILATTGCADKQIASR